MSVRFQERPIDSAAEKQLKQFGLSRALARVLAARGITCPEDLCEDWASLIPPSQLDGIEQAAERLADARERHEQVIIVSDYDCDGATACALARRGLSLLGLQVSYVVPDRFQLGYGLSKEVVDIAAKQCANPTLIMTVDNGIASIDGIAYAKSFGIDVIVTDHHLPGPELPDALAIVNPNLSTSNFPSKALAGCGVMYYLLLALRAVLRDRGVFTRENQPRLDTLCDLVALGTVADVVPLDKNNRILVSQGLHRIRRGLACPGISALFEAGRRNTALATARDLAFSIAPRINAAGRLTAMSLGIDCLATDNVEMARKAAFELDRLNQERKELEEGMLAQAKVLLTQQDWQHSFTVTLTKDDWHQGVVGLVASRIKDKVHRPVIAFAPDEGGMLKGSGRSIPAVHLKNTLERVSMQCPGLIEQFGGHAMAAGLTIRATNFEAFQTAFEDVVQENTAPQELDCIVLTDGPLQPKEINFELAGSIRQRIWGQHFEEPLFANTFTVLEQRILKDAHLKLKLRLDDSVFDAIFFQHNTPLPTRVHLAYRPEINTFLERRNLQLCIYAMEDPM